MNPDRISTTGSSTSEPIQSMSAPCKVTYLQFHFECRGFRKVRRFRPPIRGLSSNHFGEDILPERSNLFESQWPNRWFT